MKRVIKRIYIFALAFLLTVFTVSISTNVNASDLNQIASKNDVANNTEHFLSEIAEKSKTSDIFEVESMREENVKHFRLEDGTYRAITYDRPVHIKDENGKWQEIDNTLTLNEETYKTKDNRIILSKNISSEPFLKQTNDDYSIQWSIVGDRNSTGEDAVVTNYKGLEENKKIDLNDEMYKIQNSSKVYYTNIYDNVNLEYYLEGNTVITKLKLDTLENCDISFIINVDNLDIKIENRCLMFYNLKKGNLEYKLLAPYMIYENEINSNDINYTLQKIKDGEYKVTLSVDLSSYNINNSKSGGTRIMTSIRPEIVIVGPGGGGGGGSSNNGTAEATTSYDTYISSSSPSTNYGTAPEVKINSSNSQIGFLRFYEPSIPDGSTIVDAFMKAPYYYNTSSSNYMNLGAYEILDYWVETSVTWNHNIDISSTRLSTAYTHANATIDDLQYVTFTIVDAAKSWYAGTTSNYGIAIKYENGNGSSVNLMSWESYNEHTTMTVEYTMDNLTVQEATYFIKNGHLDKFIQIDDGDSGNNYNTQNAILEIWEGTGVSFQKWEFEYLHNGYYKIESYRSGKVIAVKEGNENSSNDALVQQTYNGSYRQQWKITITSSGKYKIKPRSSESYDTDWVMCIGEGIGGNGRNVEQRSYSNNSTYKDEWILYDVTRIYGNKQHRDLNASQLEEINCHGYAMFRNDWPWEVDYGSTGFWCYRAIEYYYTITTINNETKQTLSEKTKADFEEWLNKNNYDWTYESDFSSNGESRIIENNQYRVVMRIGLNSLFGYDYHFWYQNFDGTWSNKHGDGEETHLPAGVTPFTLETSGWSLDYYVSGEWHTYTDFYDGEIYSYIITVN